MVVLGTKIVHILLKSVYIRTEIEVFSNFTKTKVCQHYCGKGRVWSRASKENKTCMW